MIRYRQLAWPRDRESVAQLDTSFATATIYAVTPGPLGFALAEQRVDPPLHKRYDVQSAELSSVTYAAVAEYNGQMVGVVAFTFHGWNRRAVISHLYVDRSARRMGVGGGLLQDARRRAEDIGARCLWVETQNVNVPAVRFYQRHGFVCCGLDTSLYDPRKVADETAVFFALRLEP